MPRFDSAMADWAVVPSRKTNSSETFRPKKFSRALEQRGVTSQIDLSKVAILNAAISAEFHRDTVSRIDVPLEPTFSLKRRTSTAPGEGRSACSRVTQPTFCDLSLDDAGVEARFRRRA